VVLVGLRSSGRTAVHRDSSVALWCSSDCVAAVGLSGAVPFVFCELEVVFFINDSEFSLCQRYVSGVGVVVGRVGEIRVSALGAVVLAAVGRLDDEEAAFVVLL